MTILMQCVNIYLMFVIVRFHILPGCRPECSVSDTTICTCGNGWTVHEHCWYVLYIKHILLVRWSANLLLWDEALFSYWCMENGIVGWHFINKLLYLTLMKEEKCFFCCKTISCHVTCIMIMVGVHHRSVLFFYLDTVLEMGRMSDYDIRPKPKVWAGSPNECRTYGRTSAECCALGWNNVFHWWAHWAARKCRSK